MGKFIGGILFTIVVIAVGGLMAIQFGLVNLRADVPVPRWEQEIAEKAGDNYITHHAQKMDNPVPVNDASLIDGAKLYNQHCAVCHGGPAAPISPLRDGFYPRVPQFMRHVHDDPEYRTFFLVKYGVRWTGMPGWGKVLSDDQIWKVAAFLPRMDKLPPAVEAAWKSSAGATPVQMQTGGNAPVPTAKPDTGAEEGEHQHHHDSDHKH